MHLGVSFAQGRTQLGFYLIILELSLITQAFNILFSSILSEVYTYGSHTSDQNHFLLDELFE